MLIGIHGPNQKYRQNPISERAWALMGFLLPAVTALKGFSYWSLSDWLRAVETLTPRMVVIRLNHLDDLPQLQALYDSRILGGIRVVVEIFNEPNHEVEGFASIDDFRTRFMAAYSYLLLDCPQWEIGFPGVSPSKEYRSWWANCADLVALSNVLCLHLYYSQAGNVRQQAYHLADARALFPDKPLIASEYCYTGGESGNVRPTTDLAPEYAEAAQWLADEGVTAMFYYILESDDPRWHEVGEVFDETLARAVGNIVLNEGEGDTSMAFQFTLGFKDFAEGTPGCGQPVEDLQYDDHGNAWQHSTTGLLFWHKAGGEIYFFARPLA